ncbi:MAG: MauE/DoxX family redox-associated membrane protein [Hylemonella sp.]
MFLHLLGSLILSAVFLMAGVLKLFNREDTAKNLLEFGAPEWLSRPGALALPLAEITVALALWPASTAQWGAAAALALLLLFMSAIGWNLLQGKKPECRCFGQVSAKPVGQSTLVRNGVLAAVAAFLLTTDAPMADISDATTRVEFLQATTAALGLALLAGLVAGSWLALNLMQQQGRLLLRLEMLEHQLATGNAQRYQAPTPAAAPAGLPVGSKAPGFELPRLLGEGTLSLGELLGLGRPVMLVFSDPQCGPCNQLMPAIAGWQKELAHKVTVAFVNRGDRTANEEKAKALGLKNVLLQAKDEVADRFEVYGTPSAVFIGADGLIQFPAASGSVPMESLFRQASGDTPLTELVALAPAPAERTSPVQVGDPAPDFTLQSITGKPVQLREKTGRRLLLFWNPGCGYCAQMLDRLKRWEGSRDDLSPELVLISTGTVQANRDLGLRSDILLDQGFSVGPLYGASGTPSAILVDEHGKIASQVAVGASAVFALAHAGQRYLEAA